VSKDRQARRVRQHPQPHREARREAGTEVLVLGVEGTAASWTNCASGRDRPDGRQQADGHDLRPVPHRNDLRACRRSCRGSRPTACCGPSGRRVGRSERVGNDAAGQDAGWST
jgi:hypothetical protein